MSGPTETTFQDDVLTMLGPDDSPESAAAPEAAAPASEQAAPPVEAGDEWLEVHKMFEEAGLTPAQIRAALNPAPTPEVSLPVAPAPAEPDQEAIDSAVTAYCNRHGVFSEEEATEEQLDALSQGFWAEHEQQAQLQQILAQREQEAWNTTWAAAVAANPAVASPGLQEVFVALYNQNVGSSADPQAAARIAAWMGTNIPNGSGAAPESRPMAPNGAHHNPALDGVRAAARLPLVTGLPPGPVPPDPAKMNDSEHRAAVLDMLSRTL